jgi:hypothetical protein
MNITLVPQWMFEFLILAFLASGTIAFILVSIFFLRSFRSLIILDALLARWNAVVDSLLAWQQIPLRFWNFVIDLVSQLSQQFFARSQAENSAEKVDEEVK